MLIQPAASELRPFIALCHVFGELAYQRLGPPLAYEPPCYRDDVFLARPLEAWSYQDWLHFLQLERSFPSGCLPWYEALLTKSGLSLAFISAQIYGHLQTCWEREAHYLLYGDPFYPRLLAYTDDPPLGLTLRGNLRLLERPCIGVVGSRQANPFALQESFRIGGRLAELGVTVVSGGAYGCDMSCHLGVLTAGGDPVPALLVFAGGLAQLYPRGHAGYFRSLAEGGALFVSERLWQTAAKPYDFPVRNRIISGLVWELIVVQAGERSGALVSARKALDQGREVLVLRHSPLDVRAAGGAQLLADGAYGFDDCDELLCSYHFYHERGGEHGGMAG